MGGFFFERRIGAQRHLCGKDLRRCPRPLDICFLERDAAIGAVELVLIDESLAAAAANADTKTRKRIIEGNDFGLAARHLECCDSCISQPHLGESPLGIWEDELGTLTRVGYALRLRVLLVFRGKVNVWEAPTRSCASLLQTPALLAPTGVSVEPTWTMPG